MIECGGVVECAGVEPASLSGKPDGVLAGYTSTPMDRIVTKSSHAINTDERLDLRRAFAYRVSTRSISVFPGERHLPVSGSWCDALRQSGLRKQRFIATNWLSDGTAEDIQAIHDNDASDGDTITVPDGAHSWTSGIAITKGIIIEGGGGGWMKGSSTSSVAIGTGAKTFTVAAGLGFVNGEAITAFQKPNQATNYMVGTVTSYSGTSLEINVASVGGSGTYNEWNFKQDGVTRVTLDTGATIAISLTEDATHYIRIEGIHFIRGTSSNLLMKWFGVGGKPIILGNCRFEVGNNTFRIIELWTTHGLIYNCYFGFSGDWPRSGPSTGPNTTQVLAMPQVTQDTWGEVTPHGSLDTTGELNFYVEGCHFHGFFSECMDFDGGMRIIVRNSVLDNSALTSHGVDTGYYGNRWFELYDNVFVFDNQSDTGLTAPLSYFLYVRGGTGLIADNVIPDLNSVDYGDKPEVVLTVQNLQRNAGPFALWGKDISGIQYPAPRQVGFGRVTGSGTIDPTGYEGTTGYLGDSEPIYSWGNSGGANYNNPAVQNYAAPGAGEDDSLDYIQLGRDYIADTKPGYVKYTYPHPLRSGASPSDPMEAPQFTVDPVVTGTPTVGETLTSDDGTVTGNPVPTITYQWYRCTTP